MLNIWKKVLLAVLITSSNCVFSQQCFTCGMGKNGDFHATSDTILPGGIYDYTSFTIDSNVVVRVSGNTPLIIRSTGEVIIRGTINARGENGTNGGIGNISSKGGNSVGAGFGGGDGSFSAIATTNGNKGLGFGPGREGINLSGGGGAGHASCGSSAFLFWGIAGKSYGDSTLQILYGGSGGGGGSGGYGHTGGGGGAGGGIVQISSCEGIIISKNGAIICDGGNGGSDGKSNCGAGGGGSGGTIFLAARIISNRGLISAKGGKGGESTLNTTQLKGKGGQGSNGRIRIDSYESNLIGKIIPSIGYTKIPFIAQIFRTLDAKCFGSNDGYSKVRNRGGKYPITYQWSNGSTTNEIKNVNAGFYTVIVTDATGCVQKVETQINQPSEIKPLLTINSPTCSDRNDGVILAGSTGGVPFPITRNLTTGNDFSNSSAAGVMFDINTKKEISINKFSVIILNNISNDVTIWYKQNSYHNYENNSSSWNSLGTFTVQGNGTNHLTDLILSNSLILGEGTYSFYIYNKNGDLGTIKSSSIGSKYIYDHAITLFEGISRTSGNNPFQTGIVPAMYFTGHINYTITNSTNDKYDYTWGNTISSKEIRNLIPGNYKLTIADALGCKKTSTINLPAPPPISIQTTFKKSPSCVNDNNGLIQVNATGTNNTKSIVTSYLGDKKVDGIMFNFSALKPLQLDKIKLNIKDSLKVSIWLKQGSYQSYENNSNAWTNLGNFNIHSTNNGLPAEILLNNILLSTGKWSLYIFNPNGNLNTISNITTGNISAENSDIILHKGIKRISNGNPFNTSGSSIMQFSGALEYTLQNANSFSFLWNTGDQSNSISNLSAGNYILTVTDIGGCSQQNNYTIKPPQPITQISNILNEMDYYSNGIATVLPHGGQAPYYIYWPTLEQSGSTISNVSAGAYPFLIVDANGCRAYDTVSVNRTLSPIPETGVLVVIPNPTRNHIKLAKEILGMDLCTLKMYDVAGRLIQKISTNVSSLMNNGIDLENLSDGVYTFSLEDADQLFTTKLMVIR